LPYIKGCFESWAQWCTGSTPGSVSNTGKLIQGVRGTVCAGWLQDVSEGRSHHPSCPQCHGKGKVDLEDVQRALPRVCPVCENQRQVVDGVVRRDLPTTFCGKECFRCRGAGFVVVVLFDVNPATIRSTRHVGGRPPSDVCLLMDDLVTGWREGVGVARVGELLQKEIARCVLPRGSHAEREDAVGR
jgi:hypothetical protein